MNLSNLGKFTMPLIKLNFYYIALLICFLYIFLIIEYGDRNKAEVLISLRIKKVLY